MEKIVKQAFLYDFYGELLTEHQRQVYEDFVLNDYSLSEIAQERQVSRQSVHDIVKRCDRLLNEYEDTLHLVEKFLVLKKGITQIDELAKNQMKQEDSPGLLEIQQISQRLLEHL